MSARKTAAMLTTEELARELFTSGYLQALDDVAMALAVPPDAGFLAKLRARVAKVKAIAAIAKAAGSAA